MRFLYAGLIVIGAAALVSVAVGVTLYVMAKLEGGE
jgi:hypothetical protein